MDSQVHKIMTAPSTGHEGHEVHICHRCGWPFPNAHPSSRHRRAHKRICGTIEGYKIAHSVEDLSVSDDEHASDEDRHSPNPKLVKKNSEEFGSSGGVGAKSSRSEDDVFSDAVTEFSESGISPQPDKNMEQKSVKVDEISDRTEQLNDPVNSNKQSESVVPINEQGQEHKLASVNLDLEEAKTSEIAVERKEEIRDNLDSEVVEHDLSPKVINVGEIAFAEEPHETVSEIAFAEVARESIGASVAIKDESDSVKQETTSAAPENSDVVSVVSTIDKEVEEKNSLAGVENAGNSSESENAGIENRKMESNDKFSLETISAPDTSLAAEDDKITRALEKDLNDFDEKTNSKLLEAGNEKSEGAAMEVQEILDSTVPLVNSSDFPISCEEANSDSKKLEELSKTESTSRESDVVDKSPAPVISEQPNNIHEAVEFEKVAELKDNGDIVAIERTPEQPISKDSISADNICNIDVGEVSTELNHDGNVLLSSKNSEGPTPIEEEALPMMNKCSDVTLPDVEERHTSQDVNVVTSDKISNTPSLEEPTKDECDEKVNSTTKEKDGVSITDLSVGSNSISDSLEGNCGSISALSSLSNTAIAEASSRSPDNTSEKNPENPKTKTKTEEVIFEPPSFMTLVQSEIETVQYKNNNNQEPKPEAGWFPSITNVVNESEGRKKNEEVIAKVTNWNHPAKQHTHSPLKALLSEVDSPNTKQVAGDEPKENGNSTVGVGAGAPKDQESTISEKVNEEWNSPARYPIEITKEKKKKKGRGYWVPFVCCSSVHRDM